MSLFRNHPARYESAGTAGRRVLTLLLVFSGLWLQLGGSLSATTVVPLSFDETAREAEAIFVGRVVESRSRWAGPRLDWIETDYVVEVEDAVLASGTVQRGAKVTLTMWGGTVDGRSHRVVGSPALSPGERYVLMLHPDWTTRRSFSPLVGFWHGFFPVLQQLGNDHNVVVDHAGVPLCVLGDNRIVCGSKALSAKGLGETATLDALLRTLRADMPRIKSLPRLDLLRRSGPMAASGPPAPPASPDLFRARLESLSKSIAPAAHEVRGVPLPAFRTILAADSQAADVVRCKTPLVMNALPTGQLPFSPCDQECIALWNHYTPDLIFVRPSTVAGRAAWGNQCFDQHGFLNNEQMQQRFGCQWGDGLISFTFWNFDESKKLIIEADIAFNADVPWTVDNQQALDKGDAFCFRFVMMRAIGFALGMPDVPEYLSVMNLPAPPFQAYSLPFPTDALLLRMIYPEHAVPTTDVGVYLFHAAGERTWQEASLTPQEVKVGGSVKVSHYFVQNAGTEQVEPVAVWFLVPDRSLAGEPQMLGKLKYGPPLKPGESYDPQTIETELPIPATVPPGEYHVGIVVLEDQSPTISLFPHMNSMALSRERIRVSN